MVTVRDKKGRFIKGHKLEYKNSEERRINSIKNLSGWIGRKPPMTGKKHTEESRKKMSESSKGRIFSEETKIKLSNIAKNRDYSKRNTPKGLNHYKWIEDRNNLKKDNLRNNPLYKEWRKNIWTRDNWKCRINNKDCSGKIEAHHILGWTDYPELRYKINNGITLCHAHHPRRRAEEKRLISEFQKLVSVSNIIICLI